MYIDEEEILKINERLSSKTEPKKEKSVVSKVVSKVKVKKMIF